MLDARSPRLRRQWPKPDGWLTAMANANGQGNARAPIPAPATTPAQHHLPARRAAVS
jgi:hypothetical protein